MGIEKIVELLINATVGIVGAVVGAAFTLWIQKCGEGIRRTSDGKLYVERKAIRKGKNGYYIPGYGLLRLSFGYVAIEQGKSQPNQKNEELKSLPIHDFWGKNIAYICSDVTPVQSETAQFVIVKIVPT